MITVEIPKNELLRQLPEKAGYALLQYLEEMPALFRFKAVPLITDSEMLEEKYPALRKRATQTEWLLFGNLYGRGRVSYRMLFNIVYCLPEHRDLEPTSNVINVHVKNLRIALAATGILFDIITGRAGAERRGGFEIKEIESEAERHKPKPGGH